ncbi:DEAD/DEAH box helicase family protein [Paractinoplanes lichenicola]|uniref:DEAD/DEAH box helicase family protein n=1 Tax=Paractinoplanes lichenicola TaxID=2802976 RepID=A0ABS1W4Y6_9ACTN|nr:DEAD/DEAH box helicase family protein [Actinoplanes lichenicola]MBL7261811.1 DEAD/DEAH box helicase family protein [Actinoplanes lichenicola]
MADDLSAGLYETVITESLLARISAIDSELVRTQKLRPADAADRIAQLLARQVLRALEAIGEDDRVAVGIEVAQLLTDALDQRLPRAGVRGDRPTEPGSILSALGELLPDGSVHVPARPLIPLLDTTVLTNAPGEPRLIHQVMQEIESADAIDVVMAFVRKTGINPLLSALRRHTDRGRRLRVLTTTYTGSTEASALDLLSDAGAEIRVSYDTTSTRLHAKSWIFHRRTSFDTAYVGSSNLTHSAQVSGKEWNVRLSAARNDDVIKKMVGIFETYWEGGDFVRYERSQFEEYLSRMRRADRGDQIILSPLEIRLEPFQNRLLELIEVARTDGHHRNLLVSATGTGKTVMAAMDYARLRQRMPRARLLFVAHRREILHKSLATFRHALRDHAFGELWVSGERHRDFDHVFASIQNLTPERLERLAEDHFDVVVIDEFHHAAAKSYATLLDKLKPRELLGLTATPERTDGQSILHWFDDRIAAELRLWDAIEQQRLTPFAYYGIHDGVDLREVPWRRGQGYDVDALTDKYVAGGTWARLVYQQLSDRVDDIRTIRCLGFCVSVAHAQHMAEQFRSIGLEAVAVHGGTSDADRDAALAGLGAGRIHVIFSVDLFNEGVDLPTVDTLLMLRPTDSATLFLQQLGRGLRLSEGKTVCTVLDFVGQHRREFRFDRRYRALLGGTRRELEKAIEDKFPFLPAGCHLELDKVAQDIVLRNVREAVPSRWAAKVEELRTMGRARGIVSLAEFLHETGLELSDIYDTSGRTWSTMLKAAGLAVLPEGPDEKPLRRAIGRQLHINDHQRLGGYLTFLQGDAPNVEQLAAVDRRLLRMLVASLSNTALAKDTGLQRAVDLVWAHPQVRYELQEVLTVLRDAPDHLQHSA